MILFKPEHVEPILNGTKTQTRRLGKKRWNVGAVHQARTQLLGEPFAHLLIRDVRSEYLHGISAADVSAEGYRTRDEYLDAFARINGTSGSAYVWVVEFALAEVA